VAGRVNVGLSEWLRAGERKPEHGAGRTDAARLVGMWTCRGKDREMTDAVNCMGRGATRWDREGRRTTSGASSEQTSTSSPAGC
jgi:hypothetical protein